MANTERRKTLELVRRARKAVGARRNDKTLNPSETDAVEQLYFILDELEEDLIFAAIEYKVNELSTACEQLKTVTGPLQDKVKGLKNLSKQIDQVAQAVALLVEISIKGAQLLAL